MQPVNIEHTFNADGYCVINNFLSPITTTNLVQALTDDGVFDYKFQSDDDHNLFKGNATVRELALSSELLSAAKDLIGTAAEPFYAIVLDKTSKNNWGLDWHQILRLP